MIINYLTVLSFGPAWRAKGQREVQIYEGDFWQAIRGDQPMAIGGWDERQLDAKAIDQFVLQGGRTLRTQESRT